MRSTSTFVRRLVIGVRSSCDASATSWRWRHCASSSAPSIALKLTPSRPSSSRPVASTRRERSPVERTSSAASASRSTGRTAGRASSRPNNAPRPHRPRSAGRTAAAAGRARCPSRPAAARSAASARRAITRVSVRKRRSFTSVRADLLRAAAGGDPHAPTFGGTSWTNHSDRPCSTAHAGQRRDEPHVVRRVGALAQRPVDLAVHGVAHQHVGGQRGQQHRDRHREAADDRHPAPHRRSRRT